MLVAGEGDYIDQDELLCVLETAKVSVDIRASAAGKITKLLFKEGTLLLTPVATAVVGH